MAQRFIKAIGVASVINILLVLVSLVHRQFDTIHAKEFDSLPAQARNIDSPEPNKSSDNQPKSSDRTLAATQRLHTMQPDPPALSVDVSLADQAPSVRSIQVVPPAKDDLLMAELKKQAAGDIPATLAAEPKPLVAKSAISKSTTDKSADDALSPSSPNEVGFTKPKSALKAKSQALRELSAAVDDLTELLQRLKEEGQDKQAQAVTVQIESLKKLIREML